MKVLYFMTSANMGGAERLFYNTVLHIGDRSDIKFACFYPPKSNDIIELFRLKKVVCFNKKRHSAVKRFALYHWIALFRYIRYISNEQISIVHMHDTFSMLISLCARLFIRVKLIRTHHGAIRKYNDSANFYFRIIRRWIDLNIFVSATFRDIFLKINKLDSRYFISKVIYNGVVLSDTRSTNRFGEPVNGYIRLIMVGNYTGVRDHLFVLRVFDRLLSFYPNCKLLLVGNPSVRDMVHYKECITYINDKHLQENVELLFNVTNVLEYLLSADIFVYESNKDTFGIALVEAMSVGLPCVVNDLDVFVEISETGRFATLYRSKDIDDCVRKIQEVIDDYDRFKVKAQQNSQLVKEKYSMKSYIEELYKAYALVSQP